MGLPLLFCLSCCDAVLLGDSPDVLGVLHSILPHWVVLPFRGEQANGVGRQLQGMESAESGQPVQSNRLDRVLSPVSKGLRVQ
jgi:hypothetical protein